MSLVATIRWILPRCKITSMTAKSARLIIAIITVAARMRLRWDWRIIPWFGRG